MFWCGLFLHVCRGSAGVVLLVLLRVLVCCCWFVSLAYFYCLCNVFMLGAVFVFDVLVMFVFVLFLELRRWCCYCCVYFIVLMMFVLLFIACLFYCLELSV